MKRSAPLRRLTPLARARAPRRRRLRRTAMPKDLRAAVHLRAGGRCDLLGCQLGTEWHAHHRQLRSRRGPDTLANLVALCADCHRWVHAHPKHATLIGFMVPSWDDPETSPAFVHGRGWAWPSTRWTPLNEGDDPR